MDTVIVCEVAAVDHKLLELALEVKSTLPPKHKVVEVLAVIVGATGVALTVTVVANEEVPGQPLTVTVTK